MADTIHHTVIRHEIYGTSGVRGALDPRLTKVQVPKDGGTYGVEEWRSLACVAMATSRVRYTLLMDDWSGVYDDIEDAALREKIKQAYCDLKEALEALAAEWEKEHGTEDEFYYETMRLRPKELDIGAGY